MSEPFLSEIKLVSFNFPPKGWALCNGQFLPINQNQALFALLGTTYGGNGQTTFALPNLRGGCRSTSTRLTAWAKRRGAPASP
jgi:microcystin-dependent protein